MRVSTPAIAAAAVVVLVFFLWNTPGSSATNGARETAKAAVEVESYDAMIARYKRDGTPASYLVEMTTTKGKLTLRVTRELAPLGADRFFELVSSGFFDDTATGGIAVFRAIKGFVTQFGIHGNPEVSKEWRSRSIMDDPVKGSNTRGTLSYAAAGPNTRTTQLFFNLVDNTSLDRMGFASFASIVSGMDVLDALYTGYGEKPNQGTIQSQGNQYLRKDFPNLDYITSARVLPPKALADE
eukprot:m.64095 g.64095  ORF g.64095 m.64095 type:complete len:240 (-) comp7499_c0_seq2:1262-1981(-)